MPTLYITIIPPTMKCGRGLLSVINVMSCVPGYCRGERKAVVRFEASDGFKILFTVICMPLLLLSARDKPSTRAAAAAIGKCEANVLTIAKQIPGVV